MTTIERFEVAEVHNYGGFFGGDTITFDAAPVADQEAVRTLVIDAPALVNVPDRHNILAGMVLELAMDGERVDRATLLAAQSIEELRDALGLPSFAELLDEPVVLSGRCPTCERWVIRELLKNSQACGLCD